MDRLTEVVIETLCRAGVTVTCDETADGQHRITATDPDKRETYVVICPDGSGIVSAGTMRETKCAERHNPTIAERFIAGTPMPPVMPSPVGTVDDRGSAQSSLRDSRHWLSL